MKKLPFGNSSTLALHGLSTSGIPDYLQYSTGDLVKTIGVDNFKIITSHPTPKDPPAGGSTGQENLILEQSSVRGRG